VATPAGQAIEFYREVLGAHVLDVTRSGDLILHAVLQFESGCLTLSDPLESYGLVAPTGQSTSMSLALYVRDVDAVVNKAVAAGAQIREPLTTFVSGDRYASLLDPFSVRWAIMTRVEDLSFEESSRRVAEWAKQFG
jgi:PhnB protein